MNYYDMSMMLMLLVFQACMTTKFCLADPMVAAPLCTKIPYVSILPTQSKRLLAASFSMPCGFNAMLLKVYMPCDTRSPGDQMIEFTNILCEMNALMSLNNCPDFVILGGDMNTDLSHVNSLHSVAFNEFCDENDLKCCSSSSLSRVLFTYENKTS